MQEAIFGGGCFWCFEAVYQDLIGVKEVISGYSGGHVENPTYDEVCSKNTGHAEVVKITYDPEQITYNRLLALFWMSHDPTTLNQQGADKGPQYRSVIYYLDEEQHNLALKTKKAVEDYEIWPNPIVTEIKPKINFYPATEDHQNYYKRVGSENSYCTYVISPKVGKLKAKFPELFKDRN